MSTSLTPQQRFWSRIKLSKDGCWEWQRGKCKGYGRISVNGNTLWAHRFSWELHHGPVPNWLCVLHKCDNPPCCNPEHLFLGTKTDNALDRDAKGRQARQRGETHGQARLSAKDILAIRASPLGVAELARHFKVSAGHISEIRNRKKWRHVT